MLSLIALEPGHHCVPTVREAEGVGGAGRTVQVISGLRGGGAHKALSSLGEHLCQIAHSSFLPIFSHLHWWSGQAWQVQARRFYCSQALSPSGV